MAGNCGTPAPSSSVIAILNDPSTMTTTLAPTSSERIFEVMVDGSLAVPPVGFLVGFRAAAPCAAPEFHRWLSPRPQAAARHGILAELRRNVPVPQPDSAIQVLLA